MLKPAYFTNIAIDCTRRITALINKRYFNNIAVKLIQKQRQTDPKFTSRFTVFLLFLLLIAISFFPLFYKLGASVIHIWDEAIYANNALEMYRNKNYWVLYNNGVPNLYNVKPPLVIWLQCLSLHTFGINETAIRIPSALAALGTVIAVFVFLKKYLNPGGAFFASLILISSAGFVRVHVARSGDLDSVLVFFVTLYSLLFFDYLLDEKKQNNRRLISMAFFVFCAFMSKSLAGLMPLPGLLAGALLMGKGKMLLKNYRIYILAIGVILLIVLYYLLREKAQPGYFKEVWFSEFSRYTDNVMSWHQHPFNFYWKHLKNEAFDFWIYWLPIGLAGFFNPNKILRKMTTLCMVFVIYYFLLISVPSVKLDWYDAPLFPFMAIGVALGVTSLFGILFRNIQVRTGLWAIIVLTAIFPYRKVMVSNKETLPVDSLEFEAWAIREIAKQQPELKQYKILKKVDHPEHLDAINFYIKKESIQRSVKIEIVSDPSKIASGDKVVCANAELEEKLKEKYTLKKLAVYHKCNLIETER